MFDQPTPVPCAVTLGDSSECQRAGFSREHSDHQFFTETCFEETQMKQNDLLHEIQSELRFGNTGSAL